MNIKGINVQLQDLLFFLLLSVAAGNV